MNSDMESSSEENLKMVDHMCKGMAITLMAGFDQRLYIFTFSPDHTHPTHNAFNI